MGWVEGETNSCQFNLNLNISLYRVFQTTIEEKTKILYKIRDDPSFKGAFGSTMSQHLYFNQKFSRSSHVKICRDTVMITPLVIYTHKDFYLNEEINELLGQFKAAGLIDFWRYQDLEKKIINDDNRNQPMLLTLHQLFGSFEVLAFGCMIGFLVFLLECFRRKKMTSVEKEKA
jgi:hypothetical protein